MLERNSDSYTFEEQCKLAKSTVLICGIGCGGCIVSEILVRIGIGHIILMDGDKFENSNLNRQLGCTLETIGMYKAESWAKHLRSCGGGTVDYINLYLHSNFDLDSLPKFPDIICDTVDGSNKEIVWSVGKKFEIPVITGGNSNHNFWAGLYNDSIKISYNSAFANPPTAFIQAGLQAQMIIDFLLGKEIKKLQFNM